MADFLETLLQSLVGGGGGKPSSGAVPYPEETDYGVYGVPDGGGAPGNAGPPPPTQAAAMPAGIGQSPPGAPGSFLRGLAEAMGGAPAAPAGSRIAPYPAEFDEGHYGGAPPRAATAPPAPSTGARGSTAPQPSSRPDGSIENPFPLPDDHDTATPGKHYKDIQGQLYIATPRTMDVQQADGSYKKEQRVFMTMVKAPPPPPAAAAPPAPPLSFAGKMPPPAPSAPTAPFGGAPIAQGIPPPDFAGGAQGPPLIAALRKAFGADNGPAIAQTIPPSVGDTPPASRIPVPPMRAGIPPPAPPQGITGPDIQQAVRAFAQGAAGVNPGSPKFSAFAQGMGGAMTSRYNEAERDKMTKALQSRQDFDQTLKIANDKRRREQTDAYVERTKAYTGSQKVLDDLRLTRMLKIADPTLDNKDISADLNHMRQFEKNLWDRINRRIRGDTLKATDVPDRVQAEEDRLIGLRKRSAGAQTPNAAPGASKLGGPPPPPDPGEIMDGYRFKGGDPSDQNAWERAS